MSIEKYNVSLKRDVLRINKLGELSKKKFPKNISEVNKFIKQLDNNYLIRVSSPVEKNSLAAFNKFCEITNVLAEELYNEDELIWPLDNYLNESKDIDLYSRIDFSFAEDLLKEVSLECKKLKYKDEEFYHRIKSNIVDFEAVKLVAGNIKYRPTDSKISIENIPLDNELAYGLSMITINFFVALMFLGLDLEIEKVNKETKLLDKANKNLFTVLLSIDKKYNLKASDSIEAMKSMYSLIEKDGYISDKFNNKKAIALAEKYMKELHLCRYSITGYEKLVAESKALIKDSIAQGVDYNVLNENKSIVEHFRGNHREFVIQGNRTTRDYYIFENLADDKVIAKGIMAKAGVNVPKSVVLTAEMNDRDIDEIVKPMYNTKLVVKPRSTNYGTGITVFSEPANKTQIMNAIKYAFEFDNNVLIEEYVKGMEYRFLVIDGKCLSVCNRRNASVVGDGKSTILELINAKNKEEWHYLTGCPVKKDKPVNEYLKLQDLTLDSVPAKGKRITLRSNSNCSTGGESVDYTETMPTKFKRIAEKAAASFNAKICGVDIIIEDIKKDKYAIIEINDNPGYSINEWSYEGPGEKIGVSVLKLLKLI